ncbi:protein pleiotropic regulator PRL2-like [Ricinus communis]|uniref:protein pleiotropic regulator PRL2-like n=1 Tax=Ricinus communis TaxID=3988 RepID=UPI00201AFFF4|nr:protein pleiotropic regulator PRL2-like [Ricinus communis]
MGKLWWSRKLKVTGISRSFFLYFAVVTYVVTRPRRELLFTVVSQEEKYKTKVCIDVIVQRLGDATAAGMYKLLFSTLHGRTSTVSVYALPIRPDDSRDPQKGGIQNALVVGPTMQQKGINNVGPQGKSTALISGSKSSERFSTSAIMERIPSKWPRPVWHPPWKNYRYPFKLK